MKQLQYYSSTTRPTAKICAAANNGGGFVADKLGRMLQDDTIFGKMSMNKNMHNNKGNADVDDLKLLDPRARGSTRKDLKQILDAFPSSGPSLIILFPSG